MASEFKLSYTGSEVNKKLGKIDGLVEAEERLTNEIAVERARINSFTALGEGSTTGDAELIDVRVGANGKTYGTAGEAVRGQVKDVKSDLNVLALSDNLLINRAFKELYIEGVNVNEITHLNANERGGSSWYIDVLNDSNEKLETFSVSKTQNEYSITKGYITGKVVAYICNVEELPQLEVQRNAVSFSNSVNNISAQPKLSAYLCENANSFKSVDYTRVDAKRITINGKIEDANSNWFYTMPVFVKAGEVIHTRISGNTNVAPVSETDENMSYIKPLCKYTGNDPDWYTILIEKDCYITISSVWVSSEVIFAVSSIDIESRMVNLINRKMDSVGNSFEYSDLLPLNPTPTIPKPIVTASVESLNGWTETDATIDGIYTIFDEVNKRNKKVLRFTSSNNGLVKYILPTSVDVTKYGIMLSARVLNDRVTVPNNELYLELYSGSVRQQVYFRLSYGSSITEDYRHGGWWNACFCYDKTMNRVDVSGFDPTNVTAVGFHLYSNNEERTVEIGDVSFVPKIENTGVITIIDNWGKHVPDMADYAYSKGVRLNLSVIPATITGESNAYETAGLEELNRIKAQGHFIINHTYAHTFFNNMSAIEIDNSVVKAEEWLEHHDCARGSRVVSVPSANMNVESYYAIMATNAQCIYHQWNANTYNINNVMLPYYPCVRQLHTSSLDELERALSLASLAKELGGIVVNGYHDSFWTKDNGESWKAYIDGLCEIEGNTNYGIDDFLTGKIK